MNPNKIIGLTMSYAYDTGAAARRLLAIGERRAA